MKYPAQFIKEEKNNDYRTVIFRDFPEAITCGDSFEEAYDMAVDLLLMVLSDYFKDSKYIPEPSTSEDGDVMVSIPIGAAAKVLLMKEALAQGKTQVQIAKDMGITKQQVNRLFDLNYNSKIENIEEALSALGKEFILSIKDK